jgi:hypothetical protein
MAEVEEQERTGWTQILDNLADEIASLSAQEVAR